MPWLHIDRNNRLSRPLSRERGAARHTPTNSNTRSIQNTPKTRPTISVKPEVSMYFVQASGNPWPGAHGRSTSQGGGGCTRHLDLSAPIQVMHCSPPR